MINQQELSEAFNVLEDIINNLSTEKNTADLTKLAINNLFDAVRE
jgi:hypothetical protein